MPHHLFTECQVLTDIVFAVLPGHTGDFPRIGSFYFRIFISGNPPPMKSTNKGLYLSVPTPCEENWRKMTHTASGRHCSSCNKTVVDFSLLSDAEIFAVITNSKGDVCGHFFDHQLHRNIIAAAFPRSQFIPTILMTAGLAVGIATAGHAETRELEQVEMGINIASRADSTLPKDNDMRQLPEIVVSAVGVTIRTGVTGSVCISIAAVEAKEVPDNRRYDPLYYSGKHLIN